MNSCFFIGHREASEEIFPELAETVERHIVDYGVTEFIVGNYGGFDRMAARAVISAKALHPGITLLLLLTYHPAERGIRSASVRYRQSKSVYDQSCGLSDCLCVASGEQCKGSSGVCPAKRNPYFKFRKYAAKH